MKPTNFLGEIVSRRRRSIARAKAAGDSERHRAIAEEARAGKPGNRLRAALQGKGINLIAEFKRASPSLGWIQKDANPETVVRLYEAGGACAISVLTEPDFFHGSLEDLERIRAVCSLPILRKDFVVDQFQILEAAASGADAILLIVAALDDAELEQLRVFAENLGLDALIEVHTDSELERAKNCGAKLIGVNNRDLRTFATSLETSERLAAFAPEGATLVSESGLSTAADLARLQACGYHGFLIGESLMRAARPDELIRSLRNV